LSLHNNNVFLHKKLVSFLH